MDAASPIMVSKPKGIFAYGYSYFLTSVISSSVPILLPLIQSKFSLRPSSLQLIISIYVFLMSVLGELRVHKTEFSFVKYNIFLCHRLGSIFGLFALTAYSVPFRQVIPFLFAH